MNPYSIQCPTCHTRLKVRSAEAIDQILACPRCNGMILVTPPPPGSELPSESNGGNGSDSSALLVVADKPAAAPIAHDFDLVNDLFGGSDAPPIAKPAAEPAALPIAAPPVAAPLAKSAPEAPAKKAAPLVAAEAKPETPAAPTKPVVTPSSAPTSDASRKTTKPGASGTKLPSLSAATVVVSDDALYPPMSSVEPPKAEATKPAASKPAASAPLEPPSEPAPRAGSASTSTTAKSATPPVSAKPAEKHKPSASTSTSTADAKPSTGAVPATEAAPAPAGFALPAVWREAIWYLGAGVLGILLAWGAMVVLLQFIGGGETPVVNIDPPQLPIDPKPAPFDPAPMNETPPSPQPADPKPEDKKPAPPADPGIKPAPMPADPMPQPPVDPARPMDPVKPADPVMPPVDPMPAVGPKPPPMPEAVPAIPAPPVRAKPPRVDVNARLAEKIPEIETPPTALDEFLDFLGLFTTIPISVDPEGLRLAGVGVDAPVAAKGAGLDIRTLLEEALRPHGLGIQQSDGHILVTYRNLIRDGVIAIKYPLADLAGDDAVQLTNLRELVQLCPLADLGDAIAREKAAKLEKNVLTVEVPMREQFEVLLFLERLRAARGKTPVNAFVAKNPALIRLNIAPQPTNEKLDSIIRVNFPKPIPLAQALIQLKKVGKVRMIIDWRELEDAANIGPASEVPLVADNQPLRGALDNLLRPLGLEYRVLEGGALFITSAAAQQRWLDEPTIEFHKTGELVAADRPADKLLARVDAALEDLGLKSGEVNVLQYDAPAGAIIARLPRRLQAPLAAELKSWGGK